MHTVIERSALLLLGAVLAGPAHALDMGETVAELMRRDAQQALFGHAFVPSGPALQAAPPSTSSVSVVEAPAPAHDAPSVVAIYGQPGRLQVVLRQEGREQVLDQASGRSLDRRSAVRLQSVDGACAVLVLAPRRAPVSLCVQGGAPMAAAPSGVSQ